MQEDDQIKLQAFIDGELPEAEARSVANWMARDSEAVGLAAELRQTRQALKNFEAGIKLPESREFFWSKIQREIERLEPVETAAPATAPFFARLRRWLMPTTAIAVVVFAAFIVTRQGQAQPVVIETSFADPGGFTYRDFNTGTTLVWVSYPADDGLARGKEFGNVN